MSVFLTLRALAFALVAAGMVQLCCADVVITAPEETYLGEPNFGGYGSYFYPHFLAPAPDGSLYVGNEVRRTIYHFDQQGSLLASFPTQTGQFDDTSGMAVDASGALHLLTEQGKLLTYAPTGDVLNQQDSGASFSTGLSFGPDDSPYSIRNGKVNRVLPLGALEVYTHGDPAAFFDFAQDFQFDSSGKLYTLNGQEVRVYNPAGLWQETISLPPHPDAIGYAPTKLAVTGDGLYVYDDYLATVRQISFTGQALGTAYGVPFAPNLVATASGDVLASSPSTRVVERLTPSRFSDDSVGQTLLSERAPHLFAGLPLQPPFLDDLSDGWQESAAGTFRVPGAPGEQVRLRLERLEGTGTGLASVITVYPLDAITVDPREAPFAYLQEAINSAYTHILTDHRSTPAEFDVDAGEEIGFLALNQLYWPRIPDTSPTTSEIYRGIVSDRAEEFNSYPGGTSGVNQVLLRQLHQSDGGSHTVFPYYSDPIANWGRVDQFAFLLGEDSTILLMEDLGIFAPFSDLNMIDVGLLISARLIPVPEPTSGLLLTVVLSWAASRRRR